MFAHEEVMVYEGWSPVCGDFREEIHVTRDMNGDITIENEYGDTLYTINGVWVYNGRPVEYNGSFFCVDYVNTCTVEDMIEWMRDLKYKVSSRVE